MSKRIGIVSIGMTDIDHQAVWVNSILDEHGDAIIGRRGIPYGSEDIHIVSVIVHGSPNEIGTLAGKLGSLPGLRVKSATIKA